MSGLARRFMLIGLTFVGFGVRMARADFRCDPTCYPGAPMRPPCDGKQIVCEGSGDAAALALNLVAYRMLEAFMAKKDGNLAGCRAALQAVHNVRLAIVQLRDERRLVGQWQSGLQYKAAQGGLYDESQLFQSIESTDAGLLQLFRGCGGTALRDAPADALAALRAAKPLGPYPELRVPRSADPEARIPRAERDRLDALFDAFAVRVSALLRVKARKSYRSQVGALVELADVVTLAPDYVGLGQAMRRYGFTIERLRAIDEAAPAVTERESARYLESTQPAMRELMQQVARLPPADPEDCKQLARRLEAPRASNTRIQNAIREWLVKGAKACSSPSPAPQ